MSDDDRRESTRDERSTQEDRVGALIRAAGLRPRVPAERQERVRHAVHAHWRETVVPQARWRWTRVIVPLAAAAAVVAAVGFVARLLAPGPAESVVAVVESAAGSVQATGLEGGGGRIPVPAQLGAKLTGASELTTGAGGRAALRTSDGHSVRLAGDSVVRLSSASAFELLRGTVYIDTGSGTPHDAGSIRLSTGYGTVENLGTQFEVALLERSIRLRVREGSISLSGDGGSVSVAAGDEVEVARSGVVSRRELSPSAPEWSWVTEIVALPDVDGRPLSEFLSWAAREGGWSVEFEDPELEIEASRIVLSGSIRGFTLDEALAALLETSGLRHRLVEGTLVVESSGESREE